MKETYIGTGFSIVLHTCIILIICYFFNNTPSNTRTVLMDFTLLKGDSSYGREGDGINGRKGSGKEDLRIGKTGSVNVGNQIKSAEPPPSFQPLQQNKEGIEKKAGSDPQGEVVIHGELAHTGYGHEISGSDASGNEEAGGGSGGGRILNYARYETGNRKFYFIRETILKNIRYPEKARIMGWEGKVLLSFVLEDGKTREIKIINSSGYPVLDGSAKEAIEKTIFSQKIPYKLVVIIPIEYKLQ